MIRWEVEHRVGMDGENMGSGDRVKMGEEKMESGVESRNGRREDGK